MSTVAAGNNTCGIPTSRVSPAAERDRHHDNLEGSARESGTIPSGRCARGFPAAVRSRQLVQTTAPEQPLQSAPGAAERAAPGAPSNSADTIRGRQVTADGTSDARAVEEARLATTILLFWACV